MNTKGTENKGKKDTRIKSHKSQQPRSERPRCNDPHFHVTKNHTEKPTKLVGEGSSNDDLWSRKGRSWFCHPKNTTLVKPTDPQTEKKEVSTL